MKMFDEKELLAHIRLNAEVSNLSDDDLLDIVDCIFEYYDSSGMLDLDFDEDENDTEDDCEKITDYVLASIDLSDVNSRKQIEDIVKAELSYEDSLL